MVLEILKYILDHELNLSLLYHVHFEYVDGSSEEWLEMAEVMSQYISDKYGDSIKEYYNKNCNCSSLLYHTHQLLLIFMKFYVNDMSQFREFIKILL